MPRAPTATDVQGELEHGCASEVRSVLKRLPNGMFDMNAPGFAEEAARQAASLRGSPDELEILAFMEAAMAELNLEPYDWGPDGPPPGSATLDKS